MSVSKSDHGKRLQAGTGDLLVVRLPENPTTGYRWSLDVTENLALDSDEFAPPRGGAAGAGGERVLTFRPIAAGPAQLRAAYRRPWESAGAPQDQFQLDVEIV